MWEMPRRQNQITTLSPGDYIQCPLNLDAIIMMQSTTPDVVELNCALVDDDILYDSIRISTCAYWMFKLDVLEQFSKNFRQRLYNCLPALPRVFRLYFNYQMDSVTTQLKDEYDNFLTNHGMKGLDILNNPFKMLGNNIKEQDLEVLQGKRTLREMIVGRIQKFIDTKNKEEIDFSYSLFLPEMLNPKFFQILSEAEQVVIVLNLSKYFGFLEQFVKKHVGVLRGTISKRQELFPPKLLLKHIFGSDTYSGRLKMLAWRQMYKELDKIYSKSKISVAAKLIDDIDAVTSEIDSLMKKVKNAGYTGDQVDKWLSDADGVFESFELDCTLHNLNSVDFLIPIVSHHLYYKMANGMMDFQDEETRNMMFKTLAKTMTPNI